MKGLLRALASAVGRALSANITDPSAFFVTVLSGASLSEVFNLRQAKFAGVFAPVVDSCQITLQQNWTDAATNSAGWLTTQQAVAPNSGGALVLNPGLPVGSGYLPIPRNAIPNGFGRLKTSVALTNPATFAIVAKW